MGFTQTTFFGDLFTYTGWGLAAGTQCAVSIVPACLFYLTLFVVPNSDAYLARRYPDEFPAYLAEDGTVNDCQRSRGTPTAREGLGWGAEGDKTLTAPEKRLFFHIHTCADQAGWLSPYRLLPHGVTRLRSTTISAVARMART